MPNVDSNLVKLATDLGRGTVEKYSISEANEALRQALIDINGSTELGYKQMRDGAHNGLFALIEEVLPNLVIEGLTGDEFFNQFVEMRNVAAGDQPTFTVNDVNWYEVTTVAPGVRGLRRQRLGGASTKTIQTELRGVRIYEPLRRLLAGRVDFNEFINRVSESYRQQILNDIYDCWTGITGDNLGGTTYFPAAGTYDEDTVLDVLAHVEAASGKTPIILGTAKAIRNLVPAVQGAESKSDLYRMGYYTSFYGYDVFKLPQRHAVGTTDFIFPDNVLHIVGTDSKPIKMVYEGNSIIKLTDALDNADMTQEYEFYDMYGLGVVTAANDGIGRIELSTSTSAGTGTGGTGTGG